MTDSNSRPCGAESCAARGDYWLGGYDTAPFGPADPVSAFADVHTHADGAARETGVGAERAIQFKLRNGGSQ